VYECKPLPRPREALTFASVLLALRSGAYGRKPPGVSAAVSDASDQGLTLVPISAQLELFCPPYNPTYP
jgi:hypothetical protein